MDRRIYGIETEFGVTCVAGGQRKLSADEVARYLFRKVVFMGLWAATPIPLLLDPTFFGIFEPHVGFVGFLRHLALLWLAFAVGGLLFRVLQLFVQRDVMTGLVWATKIVTDPFNDFILYRKAPVQLLKGARIDTDLQDAARH